MEAFMVGWCVACGWVVFLAPIYIIKNSFTLPLD